VQAHLAGAADPLAFLEGILDMLSHSGHGKYSALIRRFDRQMVVLNIGIEYTRIILLKTYIKSAAARRRSGLPRIVVMMADARVPRP
jgi:hypothetical protein